MKKILLFLLNKRIQKVEDNDIDFVWSNKLKLEFTDTCMYWKDLPITIPQAIGMFKTHIKLRERIIGLNNFEND